MYFNESYWSLKLIYLEYYSYYLLIHPKSFLRRVDVIVTYFTGLEILETSFVHNSYPHLPFARDRLLGEKKLIISLALIGEKGDVECVLFYNLFCFWL